MSLFPLATLKRAIQKEPMYLLWPLYVALILRLALAGDRPPPGSTERVEGLLRKMSIEDKAGQMTQMDLTGFVDVATGALNEDKLRRTLDTARVGSLFDTPYAGGGGPPGGLSAPKWRELIRRVQEIAVDSGSRLPLLFGIDSVHGANYVGGATLFPQQIMMAASFNMSVAFEAGRVAAKDSRAAAMPWLFSPILGIAVQPQWARVFETFGEDPYLVSKMGAAIITGIQASLPGGADENDGEPLRAAACMKHFMGYSTPVAGKDRAPSLLPERELRELFLPSFRAAVAAGALTAMESYNEIDGVPVVSSRAILSDVLRGELGFRGLLVTDYNEVKNLMVWHNAVADLKAASQVVLTDTTVDMAMMPYDVTFQQHVSALVRAGSLPEARLDASVRRILAAKEAVGLLDNPVPRLDSPLLATVGSAADVAAAIDAAREAVTLLKNVGRALPLRRRPGGHIVVAGESCRSL
ncbi:unnamed protein product, partial [Phaeothamnion confervicola]